MNTFIFLLIGSIASWEIFCNIFPFTNKDIYLSVSSLKLILERSGFPARSPARWAVYSAQMGDSS